MKRYFYSIIMICLVAATNIWAQQYPLFTNYLTNGYGFNPALIGLTERFEIRGVTRQQWLGIDGRPQTNILGLSGKIGSKMALGGFFFNDGAGRLTRTGGTATLAFSQPLGERSALSLGFSAGYHSLRLSNEVFARNIEPDNVIIGAQAGSWIPDMSIGAFFNQKDGLFVGFSIPQLYQKKIYFDPTQTALNTTQIVRQYYGLAGYNVRLNDRFTVQPSAMIKVSPNVAPQYDFSLKGIVNKTFWIGGTFRTEDAMAAMVGMDFPKWSVSYSYDLTTSQLRATSSGSHELSFAWRFPKEKCKDQDGDGICDKEDKCPKEPGTKENQGCPEKKEEKKDDCPDKDKDGICDKDDKCPELPGLRELQGCPFNDRDGDGIRDDIDKCPDIPGSMRNEGCPLSDRDRDGILDEIDPCPDVPGPLSNQGCPLDNDRDKDGVPDKDDACPETPGPKDNKGCPAQGDRDKDGIPDDVDPCPNTYGPKENNGCPTVSKEEKDIAFLAIKNLYFDTDKWNIRPSAYRDLNNLVRLLKDKKDWKVRITGHADSRGNPEHNLMLSKNRAEAVRNYLVSKGIRPSMILIEYFGDEQSNRRDRTETGLQMDRRVDIEFVFD